MMRENTEFILAVSIIAAVSFYVAGIFWVGRFLKAHPGKAVKAWFAALVFGGWIMVNRIVQINHTGRVGMDEMEAILWLLGGGLLFLGAVPLMVKLYCKWIGGELSPEEKAGGGEGVRAWLRGENLFCVLVITFSAWKGFGYPFWGILALNLGALLAYPFATQWLLIHPSAPPKMEGLSTERERVLKLLEEGKITAEESAELLNALSETAKIPVMQPAAMNPAHKMIISGGALVLLGFFLPWFTFNPGNEVNRMTRQMQPMLPEIGGITRNLQLPFNLHTAAVNISGGDIQHGLGWLVLFLGVGAAAANYASLGFDAKMKMTLTLGALGSGAIILIYLLTQNFHLLNAGVVVTLAGYLLIFSGYMKGRTAYPL